MWLEVFAACVQGNLDERRRQGQELELMKLLRTLSIAATLVPPLRRSCLKRKESQTPPNRQRLPKGRKQRTKGAGAGPGECRQGRTRPSPIAR